jgi:transposase
MAKHYTKDFKVQICKLVIDDNLKPTLVAKQFGLNHVMVYRWVDEYQTLGTSAFVGKGNLQADDAKLKKLEKELELLRQENEILKKAAAYFAKAKQQD